jgi:hypothetical protein
MLGLVQRRDTCARKPVRLRDDPEDGRSAFVIVKADTRKIDRAVAAVLAFGAASGAPPKEEPKPELIPWACWV